MSAIKSPPTSLPRLPPFRHLPKLAVKKSPLPPPTAPKGFSVRTMLTSGKALSKSQNRIPSPFRKIAKPSHENRAENDVDSEDEKAYSKEEIIVETLQRHLEDIGKIKEDLNAFRKSYMKTPIFRYILEAANFPDSVKSRIRKARCSTSSLLRVKTTQRVRETSPFSSNRGYGVATNMSIRNMSVQHSLVPPKPEVAPKTTVRHLVNLVKPKEYKASLHYIKARRSNAGVKLRHQL